MSESRAEHMQLVDGQSSIAIALERWQFPDEHGEDEDWLVIGVSLRDLRGAWKASGPFLTLRGVQRLAGWMSSLARSQPADREVRFLEPYLEFEQVQGTEDSVQIRVRLDGDCLPPWRPFSGAFYDDKLYFLTLRVTRLQFAAAAGALVAQIEALTGIAGQPRPVN